jgi:hypothetical protein
MTKSKPCSLDMPEHVSVSVRKIDNGYIMSRSHSKGGECRSHETYHAKKPSLDVATAEKPKSAPKQVAKVSGSMKPVKKAGGKK